MTMIRKDPLVMVRKCGVRNDYKIRKDALEMVRKGGLAMIRRAELAPMRKVELTMIRGIKREENGKNKECERRRENGKQI